MTQSVQLSFGRLRVSPGGFPRMVELPPHVEMEVLAFADTPWGARALADLLDVEPQSPQQIIHALLRALSTGELEFDAWTAGPVGFSPVPEPADLAGLAADEPHVVPSHAVVLELIDTEDRPVAGAAYHLIDPQGREHRGHLDMHGRAEVRNVRKPGDCKVSFPGFDHGAWTYFSAHPL